MSDAMTRKLAAILAADVVGYSRMMAANERETIRAVRELRSDLIEPGLAQYGGRLVKAMGDGFLMEFGSAVAAVEAACDLQNKVATAYSEIAADRQIVLRIGLHVGDVVVEGADLFGDGVNVAARLEPLAHPGGLAISDEMYKQVRDRLDLSWQDGGLHDVKNMPRPLQIWHYVPEGSMQAAPAAPSLPLPDKPSVAVLPFDNMSNDPEQDFFADGMAEDLITDLSKISGLFVVARNSTFAFKGQPLDIPAVARRLGVAHVIEGSVRKTGNRVRINVQLIDGKSGGHVWADRYDGSLDAVFELQDDVCRQVIDALSVRLTPSETQRISDVHTTNVDAFELYVRAKAAPYPPVPERMKLARDMYQQVTDMAPDFAGGYAGLAWMVGFGAVWGRDDPNLLGTEAEALAYKALSVDPNFGWTYSALAWSLLAQRRFEEALAAAKTAQDMIPNDPDGLIAKAVIAAQMGRSDISLDAAETALRLSPNFVNGPYLNVKAHGAFLAGDFRTAVDAHTLNVARGGPVGPPAYCWAIASHWQLGELEKAALALAALKDKFPQFRLAGWNLPLLIQSNDLRDRVLSQFLAAGIPE